MSSTKYDHYLHTDDWKQKRDRCFQRAGYHCEALVIAVTGETRRCGKPASAAHHRHGYANVGREGPEDLMAVCRSCHRALDNLPPLKKPRPANDNRQGELFANDNVPAELLPLFGVRSEKG